MPFPRRRPADPFSGAYREWTWELYGTISGRASYDATHEASPFDLAVARVRPFPYQTGSLALVGRDLVARGHLLQCLAEFEASLTSADRRRRRVHLCAWSNSARAGAT